MAKWLMQLSFSYSFLTDGVFSQGRHRRCLPKSIPSISASAQTVMNGIEKCIAWCAFICYPWNMEGKWMFIHSWKLNYFYNEFKNRVLFIADSFWWWIWGFIFFLTSQYSTKYRKPTEQSSWSSDSILGRWKLWNWGA